MNKLLTMFTVVAATSNLVTVCAEQNSVQPQQSPSVQDQLTALLAKRRSGRRSRQISRLRQEELQPGSIEKMKKAAQAAVSTCIPASKMAAHAARQKEEAAKIAALEKRYSDLQAKREAITMRLNDVCYNTACKTKLKPSKLKRMRRRLNVFIHAATDARDALYDAQNASNNNVSAPQKTHTAIKTAIASVACQKQDNYWEGWDFPF